jgi:hypothetical protein
MYEIRWHFNIEAWYLLIHEIPSYLKKWKGSTEKLFNTSTSYCIPEDKYEFHWIQSLGNLQDFNLYSFIRENLLYWDPAKLKEQKLPSSSGYLLTLWGTLHSAKTEWLRILLQSCQRGHKATTENYAWQAYTRAEPRYQKRSQGKSECRTINLTFMGPCIISIFQYMSNTMQCYTVYLYLETALHVLGSTSTHHHECIQLYLQHLVFVTPLLLPAAIVKEFQLFHDSGDTTRNM